MRVGGKFTNYMENKKITYEQMCDRAFRRSLQVKVKSEAVWVTFIELKGLVNLSALAREYFERTPAWISQRINGNMVLGKRAEFTEAEYHELAEAFRDIARRLNAHADEIDSAEMESDED